MDQRQVFSNEDELFSIVLTISEEKRTASLLIDQNGLTRLEGKITSINKSDRIENSYIAVDNNHNIYLKEIIGINGLFRSDYSEC
jgi:hypothetical protein